MAKKSLLAQHEKTRVESNPGAGLPALFQPAGALMAVADPLYQRTPYVQFVSMKGSAFAKILPAVPDLNEGDPVLILPDPQKPRKLTPFRFYLVHAFQHFSEVDQLGIVLRTSTDPDEAKADRKLAEHVESVVLVVEPNAVTPARCTWKTTKVNAIHAALAALKEAQTADWGKLSADHQATLAIPDPRFRFTSVVQLKAGTGRASGYKYVAANATVRPAGIGDWKLLTAAFSDEAFRDLCDGTVTSYNARVSEIQTKVG